MVFIGVMKAKIGKYVSGMVLIGDMKAKIGIKLGGNVLHRRYEGQHGKNMLGKWYLKV
ncbi:hypothetical protein AM1BK_22760 [Neobacillus kokaensis]|uniref:Uncharacterized protein n=1 Tax=Neobacillus kokaensis TaxID=2759023 RepID=A0ABQ3N5G6_9BACI|nr:hypothetical protein AM1BK_22760 [Neobacillus kokaensis]